MTCASPRALSVIILAAALAGASCATAVKPPATTAAAPADPAAEALRKDVIAVATDVAALRQLPFQRPIAVIQLSAAQAREILAGEIDRDLPAADADARVRLLAMLRLLPERFALREELLDLFTEQAAGFYLPSRGQLVMVSDTVAKVQQSAGAKPGDTAALFLSHELSHALIDQHFDLARVLEDPALRGRDDVLFARQALAEGDAMLASMLYTFRRAGVEATPAIFPSVDALRPALSSFGAAQFPEFDSAPVYVRTQLLEPYLLGLDLVATAWKSGGWKAVDAIWRQPPASSEQLLHPDRRGDPPQEVPLDDLPAGWSAVTSVQLGELGLRIWLALKLDPSAAARAAAGWDGDKVLLLERPRRAAATTPGADERASAAFAITVWDDAAEAAEFVAAAEQWLRASTEPRDEWRIDERGTTVRIFLQPAFPPEASIAPVGDDPWARPPSPLKEPS